MNAWPLSPSQTRPHHPSLSVGAPRPRQRAFPLQQSHPSRRPVPPAPSLSPCHLPDLCPASLPPAPLSSSFTGERRVPVPEDSGGAGLCRPPAVEEEGERGSLSTSEGTVHFDEPELELVFRPGFSEEAWSWLRTPGPCLGHSPRPHLRGHAGPLLAGAQATSVQEPRPLPPLVPSVTATGVGREGGLPETTQAARSTPRRGCCHDGDLVQGTWAAHGASPVWFPGSPGPAVKTLQLARRGPGHLPTDARGHPAVLNAVASGNRTVDATVPLDPALSCAEGLVRARTEELMEGAGTRRAGWLDRAGPHWRCRGQRLSRAAQTRAPQRQAQCSRSHPVQSCSLHAPGAVPGKDHSAHRSAVEKGARRPAGSR